MIITLRPEIEQALREAAARRNMTVDELVEERLQGIPVPELLSEPSKSAEQAALRARVKAARGSLAYLGPSTLMQTRQQERALEEKSGHRGGDAGR